MEHELHLDSIDLCNLLIRRTAGMELGLAIPKTQNNSEELIAPQLNCVSEFQGLERKLGEWCWRRHRAGYEPVFRMDPS